MISKVYDDQRVEHARYVSWTSECGLRYWYWTLYM